MAHLFLDTGGDATGGLEGWTAIVGAVSVVATPRTGPNAIQCDSTGSNLAAYLRWDGPLALTGRCSFGFRFSGATAGFPATFMFSVGASHVTFTLRLASTRKLRLATGAINTDGTTVLSTGTYYRICVTWNIASAAVHTIVAVLSGPTRAIRLLQTMLVDVTGVPLRIDGVLGPATLGALEGVESDEVREEFVRHRILDIGRLVEGDPTQVGFLTEWLARTLAFL